MRERWRDSEDGRRTLMVISLGLVLMVVTGGALVAAGFGTQRSASQEASVAPDWPVELEFVLTEHPWDPPAGEEAPNEVTYSFRLDSWDRWESEVSSATGPGIPAAAERQPGARMEFSRSDERVLVATAEGESTVDVDPDGQPTPTLLMSPAVTGVPEERSPTDSALEGEVPRLAETLEIDEGALAVTASVVRGECDPSGPRCDGGTYETVVDAVWVEGLELPVLVEARTNDSLVERVEVTRFTYPSG